MGRGAPLWARQDSSVLTECALPCRLARMGQSRVVSTDQGISAGSSAAVQAGGLEVGNIFLPEETAVCRSGFEYIVAVVTET